MKNILFVAALFASYNGFTQCPFPVTLNTTGNCLGATLDVSAGKTLQVFKGSVVVIR